MSNLADELSSLMRAGNAGDAGAYRTLLQLLAGRLRITVRRALSSVGRSTEEAEDIVQETLLAIHLKRHTWDDRQPLEPWARGIARYKMIDALRRRGFAEHKSIDDFADALAAPRFGTGARRSGACSHLAAERTIAYKRGSPERRRPVR